VAAHTCNLSYSGSGDEEDHSSWPAWAKNYQDPISTNKTGHHPSNSGGIDRRIKVQTSPIPKLTNTKRAGVVAQMVGYLPSKHETPEFKLQHHKKRVGKEISTGNP
jgi:hypothetical protein